MKWSGPETRVRAITLGQGRWHGRETVTTTVNVLSNSRRQRTVRQTQFAGAVRALEAIRWRSNET